MPASSEAGDLPAFFRSFFSSRFCASLRCQTQPTAKFLGRTFSHFFTQNVEISGLSGELVTRISDIVVCLAANEPPGSSPRARSKQQRDARANCPRHKPIAELNSLGAHCLSILPGSVFAHLLGSRRPERARSLHAEAIDEDQVAISVPP